MQLKDWYLQQTPRMKFRYAMLGIALFCAMGAFTTYYSSVALAYYYNPTRTNAEGRVIVLVANWCPFCKYMKHALAEANFPFEEIDVEKDWKTNLAFSTTNRHGIPVTIIGSSVVPGGMTEQLVAIRDTCTKANLGPSVQCDKIK
jgi:glutaredoxin